MTPSCMADVASATRQLELHNKVRARGIRLADDRFCSTNARYSASLDSALTQFRTLLSTVNSRSWKPLPSTGGSSTSSSSSPFADPSSRNSKGKGRELVNGIGSVDLPHVQVHKRAVKGQADVVRAVAELPASVNAAGESNVDLESFKAVLQTSEVRGACESMF